jgi:hypothetical protein
MALALLGCEDEQGPQGPSSVAVEPHSTLEGLWGMHTDKTDFVGVQLSEDGSELRGKGCYDGWPNARTDAYFAEISCGEIFGSSIEGRHVRFTFEASDFGGLRYTSDAYIARDAARMAGTVTFEMDKYIGTTRAVWLPMEAENGWLASELRWPQEIDWLSDRGGYDLTLQEPAAGSELVVGKPYRIDRAREGLVGDLGAFYASEVQFATSAEGELVLSAGPVAETEPNAPIRLALHFAGPELQTVEAETPSGTIYTLSATRRPEY